MARSEARENLMRGVAFGWYLTVAQAARKLGCSNRRVRALLSQKRLRGQYYPDARLWIVNTPLTVTLGSRGPRLGVARSRQLGVDPHIRLTERAAKPSKAVKGGKDTSSPEKTAATHPQGLSLVLSKNISCNGE